MKKKFKIIDTSTGQKIKLKEGEMIVMNSQGIFFLVGNFMDYDTYVKALSKITFSDVCPMFDVQWKGEE
ncbi:hypothetical protein D3C80_1857700 [compost metagenome]